MTNFSIITPVYNNPKEVREFLKSLSKINLNGCLEIIVLDDSSNIDCSKVAKSFSTSLPIKYVRLKRKYYIGEKRNLGASKAKSEIIVFSDSDITFTSNSIIKLIEVLKDHPEVAMSGGKIMQDGKKLHPTKNDRLIERGDIFLSEVMYSAYLATYKSIFQKLGGYDLVFENRGEGTDLSIKYWRAGFPLARTLESIVYHPSFKASRKTIDRIAEMYRSLYLVAYKYGILTENSSHFAAMQDEREDVYGRNLEYLCIYATAKYIDWFSENHKKLKQSRQEAERLTEYDLKPFDIFTNKKELERCLTESSDRIKLAYRKAWNKI